MKNTGKKYILSFLALICLLFTTSCGTKLSISNLSIQKLTNKAQKLMQAGDFEGAIGRLESINDLNPNLAENHYNLGIAYYKTDEKQKAVNSLEKAIILDEGLKDAYYTLAVIYEEFALANMEKLEKTGNDKEKKVNLLIKIMDDYGKARENFVIYTNRTDSSTEKEKVNKKIQEFSKEIEKTNNKLAELESKL